MKKIEAQSLAVERSNLILEYINQIINHNVNANISISSAKVADLKQNFCVIDIEVSDGFERHFNSGITADHIAIFYQQLLEDIINDYLNYEDITLSDIYQIHDFIAGAKSFIQISKDDSTITINFPKLHNLAIKDQLISSYRNKLYNIENESMKKNR